LANTPYSLEGPEPPVCLVAIEPLQEGENDVDALNRLGTSMIDDAQDAVLALRLLKAGWFLDPELSERVFTGGLFYQRLAGPYRQAFLGGPPDELPSGYDLRIDELAVERGQDTPVTKMSKLVRIYREEGAHASADIATENFHRSYGYQLAGTQRAAFLFTALDAMLVGMSARRIGEVKLKSTFRDRIAAALETLARTDSGARIEPNKEAEWLDSHGRRIRNALAHGRPSDVAMEAEDSYDRIQTIIRLLLRQYLEFSVKWVTRSTEISVWLDISAQSSPTAAYNKALQSHAQEAIDVLDLLGFDISAL
jgi:hypothetical protein